MMPPFTSADSEPVRLSAPPVRPIGIVSLAGSGELGGGDSGAGGGGEEAGSSATCDTETILTPRAALATAGEDVMLSSFVKRVDVSAAAGKAMTASTRMEPAVTLKFMRRFGISKLLASA